MEPAAPAIGTPFQSGTLAFLFTDIEGSTRRWEERPLAMEAAVAHHDEILRQLFIARGGHVFKTMGDAFCVAFPSVSAALDAAVAGQIGLAQADFSAVDGIRVRMAIHAGEVQARDDDYFGQPVNRVARLLSIAHGEQVILSRTAAALVRDRLPSGLDLRDLGQHRLKDLAHAEFVFQVTGPELRLDFPPLRSLSRLQHNLPTQATSFIGRDAELAEIKALITKHRVVTLLGSGGLGKTRLSLQAAADLITTFVDGVWFVELAPLGSPDLVAETLASVFGLGIPVGANATSVVTTFLRQKKLLLILDNCEHLLEAAAQIASAILRACPSVQILTSSRERLAIAGEFVYRIPTLGVPEATDQLTAAEALAHPAVRLFADRAALVLGGFEVNDETAPVIAEICRRLDGIALAIELAVPRLKILKPKDLLLRLNDRFRLLTGGDRTALPRQQTLRALIDWSYDLLTEKERVAFRRLAAFTDTITLEDAAIVIADEHLEGWEILDLVGTLLEKSLIVPASGDEGQSRYRILETTAAYALEKLKASGEEPVFRRRLVALLIDRFREADAAYPRAATEPWLATYEPYLETLRAALDWSFSGGGEGTQGAILVAYATRLWEELVPAARETALARFGLGGYRRGYRARDYRPTLDRPHEFGRSWSGRRSNAASSGGGLVS